MVAFHLVANAISWALRRSTRRARLAASALIVLVVFALGLVFYRQPLDPAYIDAYVGSAPPGRFIAHPGPVPGTVEMTIQVPDPNDRGLMHPCSILVDSNGDRIPFTGVTCDDGVLP